MAIRDLQQQYGPIQEVILQTFVRSQRSHMRNWHEPSRGEMLRTIASLDVRLPEEYSGSAKPFRSDYETLQTQDQ